MRRLAVRGIGIGSATAWLAVHVVHVVAAAAAPTVVGAAFHFICRIP